MNTSDILSSLGLTPETLSSSSGLSGVYAGRWIGTPGGGTVTSTNPATGESLGTVAMGGAADYEACVASATEAFERYGIL